MTQTRHANRLGLSKTTISYYERSRRFPPSDILIDLSRIFHVSVDYLLGLEEKRRTIEVSDLSIKDVDFLDKTADFLRYKNDENCKDDKNGGNDDQETTV